MAVLISQANNNLTTASGWATIETGTGSSQLTKSSVTNTTTSYVYSSAFTGTNTNVCDGLLLYCNRLNTTGTVSVALSEDNGTTATREVTVNASDLPATPSWVFFKFGSTLTLDGGTDYKVGIKGSSASNAQFYRDGTAGNWARRLRLTALATAAAGDVMYIVGEHTGAGATTTRTITMDSVATTDYGTGSDGAVDNGVEIGDAGIFQYGTTAATNYYFKLSGSLNVWGNGILNIGTTGTPIPRDSTAVLEFDPAADGGMGLINNNGGTVSIQGLSRTVSKDIVKCFLNTDEAANSTSLGVDTDTGWLDNDEIAVASTTRTATQTERGALNGNAGASALTVDGFAGAGGGVLNAHSGTAPTLAEVALLTRNIRIRSATSTLMWYGFFDDTSITDIDWAEFYYLGENAVGKRGLEVDVTTGSFNMQFSSMHDTEDYGMYLTNSAGNNITISNNVFYLLNTASVNPSASFRINATTGSSIVIDNNIWLRCQGVSQGCVTLNDVGITFTNNTIVASISDAGLTLAQSDGIIGTISGITIHSGGANAGLVISNQIEGTLSDFTIWRCSGNAGMYFALVQHSFQPYRLVFDGFTLFGNLTSNISSDLIHLHNVVFIDLISNSDASFSTTNGYSPSSGSSLAQIVFINPTFSNITAHTNDILMSSNNNPRIHLFNASMSGTNELGSQASMSQTGFIRSQKHDGNLDNTKTWMRFGTVFAEVTNRYVASGYAWRMTPLNTTNKLIYPGPTTFDTLKKGVNASSQVTVTIWVLKNAAYNGNAARLVLIGGIIGGIAADVTDTYSKTQKTITGATNASPIVITSTAHGYADGDRVLIEGVAGNTAANGMWTVANQTANTFELAGSTGNGAYTSGGTANVYEQLSVQATPSEAGVIEFYVDCDGNAGSIYIDKVEITQ